MTEEEEFEFRLRLEQEQGEPQAMPQQAAPATPQQRTWGQVPMEALSNVPASAAQYAKGLYQAVRHPIDTGKAALEAAQGAAVNLAPDAYIDLLNKVQPSLAGKRADVSQKADVVGQFYKNRYGSEEGFKKALATDPVGVLGDVSTVLTGGAAAAQKVPKLAEVLRKGAAVTNPAAAIPAAATATADRVLKPAARSLMQSAIKPTIKQLKTGEAATAVDTLLDYGISPTSKGVEKLRMNIDDINQAIADKISSSGATVNRGDVLNYLEDVKGKFGTQVAPVEDLNAIERVGAEFMTQFPENLPVTTAQKLKTGTYKALAGKYGEAGSASTEAQKALARGLKEKIADVVPGVGKMNAEESKLLKTLGVTERRALMELNKNPVGLAALASNPVGFAAFMADRSAAFKALAARMANRASEVPAKLGQVSAKTIGRTGVDPATLANMLYEAGRFKQLNDGTNTTPRMQPEQ